MSSLFEYYRMKTNEDDEIVFQRVKEKDITICGKTISEIINILNGLEIERQTEIQMTMENLSYIFKKIMNTEQKRQQEIIEKIIKGKEV